MTRGAETGGGGKGEVVPLAFQYDSIEAKRLLCNL